MGGLLIQRLAGVGVETWLLLLNGWRLDDWLASVWVEAPVAGWLLCATFDPAHQRLGLILHLFQTGFEGGLSGNLRGAFKRQNQPQNNVQRNGCANAKHGQQHKAQAYQGDIGGK